MTMCLFNVTVRLKNQFAKIKNESHFVSLNPVPDSAKIVWDPLKKTYSSDIKLH
jgi:hypothetical protein